MEALMIHFVSLKAATHIEAEIVSAMCLILNQQNIKRFQEEIYCLPPDIVNMAIGNHPDGEFLQPKTKKPFRIFTPVCYSEHWWIWVTNARKRKFYILDLYHKTCPSETRMKLNKFVGYVISRIRVYAGAPLRKKDNEIEPLYINISGQKTSYDCAIYKEVDHFRLEFASRILFHEMNQDRAEAIRGSDAIRLSKPSSLLLSPYCHIDSYDIDSD
ncbi:hypothetical protein Ahy_B02g060398 [Arachis hypogaea]|uniref:Ubiquitin-like protease family profile domain-containing protein n=1 Tax=Arachis hypogaea TaxID=3818 RepID=A0A445AIJ1_ARAHY|nr:hypothetical protein Ahy_B02g060398 [Arachis hypogaea]